MGECWVCEFEYGLGGGALPADGTARAEVLEHTGGPARPLWWGEVSEGWSQRADLRADPHGTRTHARCLCSRLILVCHPLLLHLPFHKFGLGNQLCPYSGFLTHKWKPHFYSCWLLQWSLSRMEKLLLLGIFTEPQSGSLSSCENFESCPCSLSRPCLHLGIDVS